jgi:hypothetical protein
VDPVYVTQTTIAVTILHRIHYSIDVPKTKKRIIGFQNIIGFFIITLGYKTAAAALGYMAAATAALGYMAAVAAAAALTVLRTCRPS